MNCDEFESPVANVLPEGVVRGRKNPLYTGFSRRLKQARKATGQTRFGLTTKMDSLDRGMVATLEQGQRIPRLDTVERIAYVLGLSPAFLAYGIEQECLPVEQLRAADIGSRLRLARVACGLSVLGLAQLADASHTAVGNIERGGTMPSIATVEALAKALNVSPGWLGYGIGPQTLPARRGAGAAQTAADS